MLFTPIIFSFLIFIIVFLVFIIIKNNRKYKTLIAEQKNMANFKEQTANMIIHDLKVPIATLMNIELITENDIKMKMVKQASQRMMLLIQNVLDVYKYQNTKIRLKKERLNVTELIQVCISEFSLMAEIKKITFKTNFIDSPPIIGDKEILLRIFSNIFSNAIKFSPSNGTIEINTEENKNNLLIKIRNQGPTISKDKQSLIFNRFEQAKDEKFGKVNSTGLGLTFCKLAIEAHKGEIGVNSDFDRGAEFWLKLPC